MRFTTLTLLWFWTILCLKTVPVTSGINQDDDVIIVNSTEDPAKVRKNLKVEKGKVWTVPATEIALRILGCTNYEHCFARCSRQSNKRSYDGRY